MTDHEATAEGLAAQGVHERWWSSPFDQTSPEQAPWTNCIIPETTSTTPTEGATRDD